MGNFEDWHVAGAQYAADHPELDLWPFQIKTMASDFAWRMEGCEITPETVQNAYEDWISGNNPYSVHTVRLDGYDQTGQWERMKQGVRKEYIVFLLTYCMDLRDINRFLDSIGQDIYFDKKKAWKQLMEWNSGKSPASPHHIPFDPVNVAEREERRRILDERYGPKIMGDFLYQLSRASTSLLDHRDELIAQRKRVNKMKKKIRKDGGIQVKGIRKMNG